VIVGGAKGGRETGNVLAANRDVREEIGAPLDFAQLGLGEAKLAHGANLMSLPS
jgi:hypothetical protein